MTKQDSSVWTSTDMMHAVNINSVTSQSPSNPSRIQQICSIIFLWLATTFIQNCLTEIFFIYIIQSVYLFYHYNSKITDKWLQVLYLQYHTVRHRQSGVYSYLVYGMFTNNTSLKFAPYFPLSYPANPKINVMSSVKIMTAMVNVISGR